MGRLHQFAGAGGRVVRLGGRRSRPAQLTWLGRLTVLGGIAVVLGGLAYWIT